MRFEFATATRILFGRGVFTEVGSLAADFGRHAFVVIGRNRSRAQPLFDLLAAQQIDSLAFSVGGEPTVDLVRQGTERAREAKCDLVVGLGGGSVLDAGKAIAALLANGGDPLDYLEIVGQGRPLTHPSLPYFAIPTTAGTGAEVTRNAVLGSPEHRVKVSLRSPRMLPSLALIDPELTVSMPPETTAGTGMDALTQVLEPFVSNRANPITDALCREGLYRVARSLHRAYADGGDIDAREDMALASLCGGLALANAQLGAVHGFAGPIGGMFPAPHGAVCARLLPSVMAANVQALQRRAPKSDALTRYEEVARILTQNPHATASEGVARVRDLCESLAIPPLANYGVAAGDCDLLVEKASGASSMQGNPISLTSEEMHAILRKAL
jgi:alcohol dehydrogenase class IV